MMRGTHTGTTGLTALPCNVLIIIVIIFSFSILVSDYAALNWGDAPRLT